MYRNIGIKGLFFQQFVAPCWNGKKCHMDGLVLGYYSDLFALNLAKKTGPAGGELWPTQLTHASVLSFSTEGENVSWLLATSKEHLSALGWRMYGHSDVFPVSKMVKVLDDLQLLPSQVKQLTGNSMHLRTQLAFMIFAIAHVSQKQRGGQSQMQSLGSWGAFSEDADGELAHT